MIIILINIIFGIIIDAFGGLREQDAEKYELIENTCYICGKEKNIFETLGKGWDCHVLSEHNVYNYLAFLIYVDEKERNDCNGIEKYVKDL